MRKKYIIALSIVAVVMVGFIGYRAVYKKKSELGEQPMKPVRGEVSKPAISERTRVASQMKPPAQSLPEKPVPEKPDRLPEEEKTYVISPMPEAFTFVDVGTCTGFPVEVSQRHLVWREKGGIMGFGNVEYPDDERLTICANGQWVDVKRVRQKSDETEEYQHVGPEPRRTLFGVEIGK
jgi:hypothetical protein